jgi:hypothetical protein
MVAPEAMPFDTPRVVGHKWPHTQTYIFMSNAEKILDKMRNNSQGWRIESLKVVARTFAIEWRQQGTNHVIRSDGRTLPVPAKRPIKPIYLKKFVNFVE